MEETSESPEIKESSPYKYFEKFKIPLIFLLLSFLVVGLGILISNENLFETTKVEVIENENSVSKEEIIVEVSGAVEKPGVFNFQSGKRINDALVAAGGLSADADRVYIEKILNKAALLQDGQKIYIPRVGEQTSVLSANSGGVYQNTSSENSNRGSSLVNINISDINQLDALPGIGPVYGQKIIDQRPYSNIEELRLKNIIPATTYEKIKNLISVY